MPFAPVGQIYDAVARIIQRGDDVEAVKKHISKATRPVPRDLCGGGPQYKGRTLPMLCAVHGRAGILRHVAEFFDINVQTKSKAETALHLASYFGRHEQVKHLLDLGARVDLKNEYGETPVEAAAHSKKEGAAECKRLMEEAWGREGGGVEEPERKRQAS